jgi:putative tryptophan/tyrosine transport system substrate-binding protein
MRRREFITGLGGVAAWPLAGRAQQRAMPVVGLLYGGSPEASANGVSQFRQGLSETGFVEGRNVAIEYRFAQNEFDRLPALAAEFVRRQVAVIVTPSSTPAALAAKGATSTIPIVFAVGADPVQIGLVASLNRPGGNVTGITSMNTELSAKRLGLLHELMPAAGRIAVLVNPSSPDAEFFTRDPQEAALAMGLQIEVLTASTNRDIDAAFASLVQKHAEALLVTNSNLFANRIVQLVTLATDHRVPAIHYTRDFALAGGLMSYGPNLDANRQVGIYTGRILQGERPADLPVVRPTKFELIINLKTAKALGLIIPETLLATADEVIQ